jgi:hypothetical protein
MERMSEIHNIDSISAGISSIFYKIEHKFDGSYAAKELREGLFMKNGVLDLRVDYHGVKDEKDLARKLYLSLNWIASS